ncbi:MAG: YihA family ribosome biogenesis GTP-binding protein [Firmicutes bacterium HGW-Firmicutes-1]|jgi:GTP-binding protein|nr:MAG: YihA family ribosome biogenesis GTP-binding protein [Firmicutes bacterium HGW-Firmicutes-1]
MLVNNVSLEAVGVKMEQFPTTGLPEIAFAGRSNVGKSSLINGLINRKALARTSGQPGKTRTINYYNVENVVYFVDLPGYGYAKSSKTSREEWGKMIEYYLKKRQELKIVVLLVDIRHEPSENDKMMVNWIRGNGFEPVIVATKADKINRSQIQKHISMIRKALKLSDASAIIPFSSMTKQGRDAIWDEFEDQLGFKEEE